MSAIFLLDGIKSNVSLNTTDMIVIAVLLVLIVLAVIKIFGFFHEHQ